MPRPAQGLGITIVAGLGSGAIAAGLYYALSAWVLKSQDVGLLAVGPVVGLGMRLIGRSPDPRAGYAAAAITVIAASAGFIAADAKFWTPFLLGETLRRLSSLAGIVLIGVSAYVGMLIAVRRSDKSQMRLGVLPACQLP